MTPRSEATPFGFKLTAPGYITPEEALLWFEELKRLVTRDGRKRFCLLIDVRTQKAQPAATTAIIQTAMRWLHSAGLERSAVILDNAIAKLQIARLVRETGCSYERYLNVTDTPDWEQKALDWIRHGIEPDVAR